MKSTFDTIGKAMSYIRKSVKSDFEKRKEAIWSDFKFDAINNRNLAKINMFLSESNRKPYNGYIFVAKGGFMFYCDNDEVPEIDCGIPEIRFSFIYKFHVSKPYGESTVMLEKVQL